MKGKHIVLLVMMVCCGVTSASAQGVYFGVRGGLNNTKLGIDMEGIDSERGYGWFFGPTLKIDILPFLGIQGAAMYSQNNSKIEGTKIKQKSIVVPIDARLNLLLVPETGLFLSTGPQFSFNTGDNDYNILGSNSSDAKDNIKSTFQLQKSTFSWNFGIGAMLAKRLELSYVYSIGIGKTGDLKNLTKEDKPKSKTWMASATFYF